MDTDVMDAVVANPLYEKLQMVDPMNAMDEVQK